MSNYIILTACDKYIVSITAGRRVGSVDVALQDHQVGVSGTVNISQHSRSSVSSKPIYMSSMHMTVCVMTRNTVNPLIHQ